MVSQFNILLIEDEPTVCEQLQKYLTRLGFLVTTTDSAEKAVAILSSNNSFDMVIAALCIKEKGARSLARWIKATYPHIKFLVVTSWQGELDPSILSLEGIHDVIRKPLIFNEVRDKLLEHFG